MSLRNEIRRAVDDVVPPAPGLERKVRDYVIAGNRERKVLLARRRRSPWTYRFQGAAGLLAAAVVIALLAGLIVGGRMWRDLNATPSTINQTELKTLEGKPLNFPTISPGAACPTTALTLDPQLGMVVGGGPVYLGDTEVYGQGSWGYWVELGFVSTAEAPGLVLVRAKDLKSGAQVAFANYPIAPTAMSAVGPVLGTSSVVDHHDVTVRSEAVFHDPWRPRAIIGLNVSPAGTDPELLVLFGMQTGTSGCIGFQVDGPGFSESFVVTPTGAGL
jgi:hypothetical protein